VIEAGKTLLHYRLVDKIGEGGMGVVWRAVDTSLDREVAVKVLPEWGQSPRGQSPTPPTPDERFARFEREAKLLATLNHPNIAAIYGLHEAEGVRFLAMELVAGEDLAERLKVGAIGVEQSSRFALQIAEALETAHDSGVIHRDLKPANIRLTPDGKVKVLDFGLAKAFDPVVSSRSNDPAFSPTMTSAQTAAGMIMGTAAYMSPEQAAGQPADKRCDIWSFGVVLFEMLSGQRLFAGETVSHTLADVLRAELDWSRLPDELPRSIRRLLERCLDRNPQRRLRDIGEARVALQDSLATAGESVPKQAASERAEDASPARRSKLPWIVAAAAILVAAVSVGALLMPDRSAPEQVGRFTLTSPNSGKVVTRGGSGSDAVLYQRAIGEFESREIPGTSGARLPLFSPDGRWLAFITSRGFFKVNLAGGAPIQVGTYSTSPFGATWSTDGYIYFASSGEIWKLPEGGGESVSIAAPDLEKMTGLRLPEALPSGRALLLSTVPGGGEPGRLMSLDLKSGKLEDLGLQGTNPRYLGTGHLLFVQADQVMAVAFDEQRLEVKGTPIPVLDRVWIDDTLMQLSVADNGTAVYLPQRPGETQQLVLVDREGSISPVVSSPLPFATCNDPRLSRDGRHLVVSVANGAVWVIDLETETPTRVSESGFYPLWSPDGSIVTFTTNRNKSFDLYRLPVDLSRPEFTLLDRENNLRTADWAPDGTLIFREEIPGKGMDLWIWPDSDDEESMKMLLSGPDDELAPTVSPDGRWMAYVSDQSGRDEIYVTDFPQPGSRLQVSVAGGTSPAWAPDGKSLYYLEGNQLIEVRIATEPGLRILERKPLFSGNFVQYRWMRQYDVHPDGEHFVMIENPPRGDVEVITNWFAELEEVLARSAG
jgi:serine/threonine-protein kinase